MICRTLTEQDEREGSLSLPRCLRYYSRSASAGLQRAPEGVSVAFFVFLFFVDEGRIVLPVLSAADKEVDPVLTLSVSVPLTM